MAPGRKRKPGKRYACGKRTRQETERDAMSTVIEAKAPLRRDGEAGEGRTSRHCSGTPSLSQSHQRDAVPGRRGVCRTVPAAPCRLWPAVAQPTLRRRTADQRRHLRRQPQRACAGGDREAKRRFNAATDALDACDREHRMSAGRRPTLLVYRVICTDEDAMHWPEEDIGNLRVALNALVRVFRM